MMNIVPIVLVDLKIIIIIIVTIIIIMNRLEPYIANIASLDQWLVTIRNNRINNNINNNQ